MAVPVITIDGRGPTRINRGRGLKMLRGRIAVSANTSGVFPTSNIEKFFRRCDHIEATVAEGTSAVVAVWVRSTTRLNGNLKCYGYSTAAGADPLQNFAMVASGTFVAFGS